MAETILLPMSTSKTIRLKPNRKRKKAKSTPLLMFVQCIVRAVEVKKQANALLVEWIMLLRQSIVKMATAIDKSCL